MNYPTIAFRNNPKFKLSTFQWIKSLLFMCYGEFSSVFVVLSNIFDWNETFLSILKNMW